MKKLYEAMFIADSNRAKENFSEVEAAAKNCITRHDGEVVDSILWDDRRLAYEIDGAKRATYILVHFMAEGEAVAKIERQIQLTDDLLRVLITVDTDGVETTTGSARARADKAIPDGAGNTAPAPSYAKSGDVM